MNREIKFRAWDTSDKEKGPYILGPYNITDAIFNHKDVREMQLMQFTGLQDKNGTDIYEGDIVELFGWGIKKVSDGFASIVWDIDETGWNFNRYNYAEDRDDFRKAISNCVIVGNIYENPELLTP